MFLGQIDSLMKISSRDRYISVEFHRFKAFRSFTVTLRHVNIIVGPNNSGKSTILTAFRILASGLRRATSRKGELLHGRDGQMFGHKVDLSAISVAEENLFYNYEDDEAAWVRFRLESGNSLELYFPEPEVCYLFPDAQGRLCSTPSIFRSQFHCAIGFVPILGPVEHKERLYEKEAARLALFNYGAARNFRNIWHHFPEGFEEFKDLINSTWPGMDIKPPVTTISQGKANIEMWCPEERVPREIFWAGFGFQVWCQMLTYLIQSKDVSIFLIDEPDIYLHSDLQRQLVAILREIGPDILVATHSTEIITEADTEEIVLVDKRRRRASRLRGPTELDEVFRALGSGLNPTLTQLAKTKRVVFVEGLDFQVLSRFARKLGFQRLADRSDFAVVSIEGFNPDRIRTLKRGIETTLGVPVAAAAVLDRDFRSQSECEAIIATCKEFCELAVIHESKEIENFLLVPDAIDRAAKGRLLERGRRGGEVRSFEPIAAAALSAFAAEEKHHVMSQCIESRRRYERTIGSGIHETQSMEAELRCFEARWADPSLRMRVVPGKAALSAINAELRARYGVNVTPTAIVEAMRAAEVPAELRHLLQSLGDFARAAPAEGADA